MKLNEHFCQQISNTWKTRYEATAAAKMVCAYIEGRCLEVNQVYGELDFDYKDIIGVNDDHQ